MTKLRRTVEQLEAFLCLEPPLHACALLCVSPEIGRSVLSKLFEPATHTHHSGEISDHVLAHKRGMTLLEVIGHASFNQRLWSRMNNPVHSGRQARLVSHHNTESYF